MRILTVLAVIPALMAMLPACAMFSPAVPNAGRPVAADPAETLLTEAALRAERAFVALARARSAENPLADTPLPRIVPAALLTTVTLDWTGPVETLAEELARRAGYRFFAAGPVPARPAIVAVKTTDAPLIAALRDAGIQAGQAAVLTVDADRRIVRLDWAAAVMNPGPGRQARRARDANGRRCFSPPSYGCARPGRRSAADLEALYELAPAPGAAIPFAEEKRHSAMRLTALGFGARAGLARRSWEIGVMLERLSAQLSAIYRFGDLMLTEQGFTVLPPVLAETRQAFRLGLGQDRAASARLVLRIVEPERIVSAAPHWRDYLVRSWRKPAPPAAVLFPRTGPETTLWRQWLAEGWAHGTALGDDIFAADLDRLNRTFEGVVLWHRLHLVEMVSAPGVTTAYTAAAGHERLLRIGETSVRLDRRAAFNLDTRAWRVTDGGDFR